MAHIFKYALLQAIPDPKRGERVNVGIATFLPERIDVRFSDLQKVRALTRDSWDEYAKDAEARLRGCFEKNAAPEEIIERFGAMDRTIHPSSLGWFSISDTAQYEHRIAEILEAFVHIPPKEKAEGSTRINTEIAKVFRKAKALAKPSEGIDQSRIVRDFYVSKEEELKADFALKNGAFHFAATLDLRLANVGINQAALKAIVLDKAKAEFSKKSKRLGVYAANDARRYKPHIELLKDYADKTFNWLNPQEQKAFARMFYDAMSGTKGLFQVKLK